LNIYKKNCSENSSSIKTGQDNWVLYKKKYIIFLSYLAQFFID